MKMKNRAIFGLAAALLLATAGGLWAQVEPTGFRASPQSTSTLGRYRSAADDFIRPDSYPSAKFDKWYGMSSFQDNQAVFGFATKINGLYLGAYLGGTLWQGITTFTSSKRETPFPDTTGTNYKTFDVYAADPSFTGAGATNPNNRIGVLLGVADMGIRFSYGSTYQSFSRSDIAIGTASYTNYYKDYKTEYGATSVKIDWSMAKDLTPRGIKPYAYLTLLFFKNYTNIDEYNPTSGSVVTGPHTTVSQNRVEPRVELGMGGYTFYNQNGFKGVFDLDYETRFRMYDNEYSWLDTGKYKTEKIKGIYTGTNVSEINYLYNWIRPSLSGSWSQDKVALKFRMNLANTFTSTDTTASRIGTAADTGKEGKLITTAHTDVSTYTFTPTFDLAMQYKVVPDKLTLNTGARVSPATITETTTKGEVYGLDGKKIDHSEYTATNTTFGNTTTNLYVGATFNFSNNVSVEATTGINPTGPTKTVSVFDPTDGLFAFSSILVNLKF